MAGLDEKSLFRSTLAKQFFEKLQPGLGCD
jgi:hypothetical protein